MEQKALLRLFILFLGFSYIFSISAVSLPRRLMTVNEDPSAQQLVEQGLLEEENIDGGFLKDDGFIQGRMDIESNDYPGAGANKNHDPKSPGSP